MRAAGSALAFAVAAAVLSPCPVRAAAADSSWLEDLPIRALTIAPRDVFEGMPPGPFGPFYAFANRLHTRTRPGTIRRQLLFDRGDRWSGRLVHESERLLRRLDVLVPDTIRAVRVGDSLDVVVGTQDIWSTSLEFTFESGGGRASGQIGLLESNLFGMAKSLAVTYREDEVRISRGISYGDPQLFGTHAVLRLSASDESDGSAHAIEAGMPFWAEDAPWSAGFKWELATTLARLYSGGVEAAVFDRSMEGGELWAGIGGRDGGVVTRLVLRASLEDKRFGPTRVLTSDADDAFLGGEENSRRRPVVLETLWWRPRFLELTGVEQLSGIEDVDLGIRGGFAAGASTMGLGATGNEGYLGFEAGGGIEAPIGSYAHAHAEASWWFDPQPKEAIVRGKARWVRPLGGRGATVLAVTTILGWDTPRDFQVVLGGLNGLRAFSAQEIAGTRACRVNAEQRWTLASKLYAGLSVGSAVFYDAGRTWGAGSAGEGWHHDAGFGLRLSLPGSSPSRVARFDLAWPIAPIDGGREPVLSIGSSQAF